MDDLKVGDRAVYDEDGHYTLVELLEVNHTKEAYQFRLRAIRALPLSRRVPGHELTGDAQEGEEWDCMQLRSGGWGGMWHLRSIETFRYHFPEIDLT